MSVYIKVFCQTYYPSAVVHTLHLPVSPPPKLSTLFDVLDIDGEVLDQDLEPTALRFVDFEGDEVTLSTDAELAEMWPPVGPNNPVAFRFFTRMRPRTSASRGTSSFIKPSTLGDLNDNIDLLHATSSRLTDLFSRQADRIEALETEQSAMRHLLQQMTRSSLEDSDASHLRSLQITAMQEEIDRLRDDLEASNLRLAESRIAEKWEELTEMTDDLHDEKAALDLHEDRLGTGPQMEEPEKVETPLEDTRDRNDYNGMNTLSSSSTSARSDGGDQGDGLNEQQNLHPESDERGSRERRDRRSLRTANDSRRALSDVRYPQSNLRRQSVGFSSPSHLARERATSDYQARPVRFANGLSNRPSIGRDPYYGEDHTGPTHYGGHQKISSIPDWMTR